MIISCHPGKLFTNFGIDEGFAMLKRAGIDGIQFGMGAEIMPAASVKKHLPCPAMDGTLEDLLEAMRPYKEAAEKHGVVFSQVHAPFPMWLPNDPELVERMKAVMIKSIAAAEYVNCRYLVVHPTSPERYEDILSPEDEMAINKELYSAMIPALKEHHVVALLENMFSRDVEGTRFASACSDFPLAARLVDELNEIAGEECFGFNFDTGHCYLARQNVARAIRILGKRIKALHVQDNRGHLDDHVQPFAGCIDWESVIQALRDVGYDHDFNFEAGNAISPYPVEVQEECLRLLAGLGRYFTRRITE